MIIVLKCYNLKTKKEYKITVVQNIFGISENLTYIYVGIFVFLAFLIVILQIYFKKTKKKFFTKYLPFFVMFLSIFFILPFAALVNYQPWGIGSNNLLWYKQVLQFTIVIGNIYMIILVTSLVIGMSINIARNVINIFRQNNYKSLVVKSSISFIIIIVIIMLLINLYRVFPIYNFDMTNDPNNAFVANTNPIGLNSTFNNQGYWPFFITNFLIFYFFTGNFDPSQNLNSNFTANGSSLNTGIPVFAIIVISIFALSFIIGLILAMRKSKGIHYNRLNKIKHYTDKPLKFIYKFLPIATFSFFSESLLQSIPGTFLHIIFVFVLLFIVWILFYIISGTSVIFNLKFSPKTYFAEVIYFLHTSFKKNNFEKSLEKLEEFIDEKVYKHQSYSKYSKNRISEFSYISYVADSSIFALVLIGYLAFLPINGYAATSDVNSAGFWIVLFLGAFFSMYGAFEMPGAATIGQNAVASCAFNVMCGTNTGIFGPFGEFFNQFRIVLNLNYILLLTSLGMNKQFKQDLKINLARDS